MDLGHLVSKDIRKKFVLTLRILSVDCELRHGYEDNRQYDKFNHHSNMESKMGKARTYSIFIYGKRKRYGESNTRKGKKILIGHPNIDFDMNREIDLKA